MAFAASPAGRSSMLQAAAEILWPVCYGLGAFRAGAMLLGHGLTQEVSAGVQTKSLYLHAGMGRANSSSAARSWRTHLMGTAWWPASPSAAAARSCARALFVPRSARSLLSALCWLHESS